MTKPVKGVKVGTKFGARGEHWSCHFDENLGGGIHTGVDFPAAVGTAVRAARPGTAFFADHGDAFGDHQLEVRCADGTRDFYAHMSARLVGDGVKVKAGQSIGRVGEEGNATGPHLHFERHSVAVGPWSCDVIENPKPSVKFKRKKKQKN